jgi:hypothetical protein
MHITNSRLPGTFTAVTGTPSQCNAPFTSASSLPEKCNEYQKERNSMRILRVTAVIAAVTMSIIPGYATLPGTTGLVPGTTLFPIPAGLDGPAGSLIATANSPYSFTTSAGITSGTLRTAVFREAEGTLDFYYQITNDAGSATAIARMTCMNFQGIITYVGYRTGGATFGAGFVTGSLAPVSADRTADRGRLVSFNFGPEDSSRVQPGQSSFVMVISTNATNFFDGNAAIIDGGSQTVASYGAEQVCTAPSITGASATPNSLWPPDNRMVPVTVSYSAANSCAATCTLSVASNEGNAASESQVVDANHVLLAANRNSDGNGRIYTIGIACTNSAGATNQSVIVTVPHDQGK